jgi:hypothetical protein
VQAFPGEVGVPIELFFIIIRQELVGVDRGGEFGRRWVEFVAAVVLP